MENLPADLKHRPAPVISFLGSTDSSEHLYRLIVQIDGIHTSPKIQWLNLPLDHKFLAKKPIKEKQSAFPTARPEKDFDGVIPKGILSAQWMYKHHQMLPSLVIAVFDFEPRLAPTEWAIQESVIGNEVDRLRRTFYARECKVILVLIQTIELSDEPNREERLTSLKRRTELDSKTLVLFRPHDLVAQSSVLTKFAANCRNFSLEYYRAQGKRVKRHRKSLNKGAVHYPFKVRHDIKVAYFYEFRGQIVKMMKAYNDAYESLLELLRENPSSTIGIQEIKTIAGYINYKILSYHFVSRNVKLAVDQFQFHIASFEGAIVPSEQEYFHYRWLSQQYEIFAQFLANLLLVTGNLLNGTGLESERYREPYLYYSLAAKYAIERRKAAVRACLIPEIIESGVIDSISLEKDFVIKPATFWGGDPVVAKVSDGEANKSLQPTIDALIDYQEMLERSTPHAMLAIDLLELAAEHLSTSMKSTSLPYCRLKNRLALQMGVEYIAIGNYAGARRELEKAKGHYSDERWWMIVAFILRKLFVCASKQGDSKACIDFCLQLLSPRLNFISEDERKQIQKNMFQAWLHPSAQGTADRSNYSCDISLDRTRPLFQLDVYFEERAASVHSTTNLRLKLESYFAEPMTLSKVTLCFVQTQYNITIFSRKSYTDIVQEHGNWYTNLEFIPDTPRVLTLPIKLMNGCSVLQCQEARLFLRATDAEGSCQELCFRVRAGRFSERSRRDSLFVGDGLVPLMGKGQGSPSFGRRDPVEFEQNEADLVGTYVLITPCDVNSSIKMTTKPILLTKNYQLLELVISSNTDSVTKGKLTIVTDKLNKGSNEHFFYDVKEDSFIPDDLDEVDQLAISCEVPSMTSNSDHVVRTFIRSDGPGVRKLEVELSYTTDHGIEVSMKQEFEIQCRLPFTANYNFLSDYPGPATIQDPSEQVAFVNIDSGAPVTIQASIISSTEDEIRLLGVSFIPNEDAEIQETSISGAFEFDPNADESSINVLHLADQYTCRIRALPKAVAASISLGHIKLQWRRVGQENEYSVLDVVETLLEFPDIGLLRPDFQIQVNLQPYGYEGKPLTMRVNLYNSTPHETPIKFNLMKSSEFLVNGLSTFTEHVQAYGSSEARVTLIPISNGFLSIPSIEMVSQTTGQRLTSKQMVRDLFVYPSTNP